MWPLALPDALPVGPLTLPTALLVALLAYTAALWVVHRPAQRLGVDLAGVVWRAALLGVLAARLGFVWQFRAAYLAEPLSILNVRDGGWEPQIGWVVAWVYALAKAQAQPTWRPALLKAAGLATAVWVVGAVSLWQGSRPGGHTATATTPWPEAPLQALDGSPVSLQAFKGRPVVVNLWATWCPPCRREMPVLQRSQQAHPEVHHLFVNQGESAEQVRSFLQAEAVQLQHVLLDRPGRWAARFDVVGYPTTLFFDAQGRLVARRMGELSSATLQAKVQALLAPEAQAPQAPGARPAITPQ